MNVFEDLISELKEENLLESTVMDGDQPDAWDSYHLDVTEVPNTSYDLPEYIEESADDSVEIAHSLQNEATEPQPELRESILADDDGLHTTVAPDTLPAQATQGNGQSRGKDFFKKRAMGEV